MYVFLEADCGFSAKIWFSRSFLWVLMSWEGLSNSSKSTNADYDPMFFAFEKAIPFMCFRRWWRCPESNQKARRRAPLWGVSAAATGRPRWRLCCETWGFTKLRSLLEHCKMHSTQFLRFWERHFRLCALCDDEDVEESTQDKERDCDEVSPLWQVALDDGSVARCVDFTELPVYLGEFQIHRIPVFDFEKVFRLSALGDDEDVPESKQEEERNYDSAPKKEELPPLWQVALDDGFAAKSLRVNDKRLEDIPEFVFAQELQTISFESAFVKPSLLFSSYSYSYAFTSRPGSCTSYCDSRSPFF